MPIKHLVIAGGGPIGLQFLGALEHLNEQGFWNFEDIESIYATSIGTFLGAIICLKYDWSTLNKYIIERPWHDAFKLNGKQILDAFYNKGLYDKKVIEIVFKPLLEAKDLSLNITLKEFYEYSKIEFHLYTFELNKFETTDISYKTHPDLLLTQAIHMSSALPGVFIPTISDNGCYIDGGVMANYPLSYCLQDCKNEDEILGIKDLRTDKRIDFIGGIRGLGELKMRVDSGDMKVAFALYPVSMKQLIDIADSGNIMPPKTTWFEPKLRSGLVVHELE